MSLLLNLLPVLSVLSVLAPAFGYGHYLAKQDGLLLAYWVLFLFSRVLPGIWSVQQFVPQVLCQYAATYFFILSMYRWHRDGYEVHSAKQQVDGGR